MFPLDLQGLTTAPQSDGSIELLDASGAVEAVIPTGYMQDSHQLTN